MTFLRFAKRSSKCARPQTDEGVLRSVPAWGTAQLLALSLPRLGHQAPPLRTERRPGRSTWAVDSKRLIHELAEPGAGGGPVAQLRTVFGSHDHEVTADEPIGQAVEQPLPLARRQDGRGAR